jgi:hypothetical protein
MALVTGLTKTISLPDGKDAQIRKLSWKQLKEAAKVRSVENIEGMKAIGSELLRMFRESQTATEAADKASEFSKAMADKAETYDRETVLKHGLVSIGGFEIADADRDLLDEPSAAAIHDSVVAFSREAVTKNG